MWSPTSPDSYFIWTYTPQIYPRCGESRLLIIEIQMHLAILAVYYRLANGHTSIQLMIELKEWREWTCQAIQALINMIWVHDCMNPLVALFWPLGNHATTKVHPQWSDRYRPPRDLQSSNHPSQLSSKRFLIEFETMIKLITSGMRWCSTFRHGYGCHWRRSNHGTLQRVSCQVYQSINLHTAYWWYFKKIRPEWEISNRNRQSLF